MIVQIWFWLLAESLLWQNIPLEVAEITSVSKALGVNLGNITDIRMESMLISGKVAFKNKIPQVIDLVGVGCSNFV